MSLTQLCRLSTRAKRTSTTLSVSRCSSQDRFLPSVSPSRGARPYHARYPKLFSYFSYLFSEILVCPSSSSKRSSTDAHWSVASLARSTDGCSCHDLYEDSTVIVPSEFDAMSSTCSCTHKLHLDVELFSPNEQSM